MNAVTCPALLNSNHDISRFSCGEASLDDWLKKRALKNQENGASRTFVICNDNQVIGYYALATGSVERINSPKSIARNMPDPIPVIVLARLAIVQESKQNGLGSALLKDAMLRTLTIADNVGVRALLVHTISDEAKDFYLKYGFQETAFESMTLMFSISNLKKVVSE